MIRIAQAASSETFSKYGTAPNQRRTGVTVSNPGGNMDGELNVINFTGGWEAVYRIGDSAIADKIATFMERAVANGSHIGYSQDSTRFGVWDALASMNSTDPSQIKTLVNCDCATLVGAAVNYSGIKRADLRGLVTWRMDAILTSAGFKKLTDKDLLQSAVGIKRGDILWETGHTAVALDSARSTFLKDNELRTKDLYDNSYYLYSSAGTANYTLKNDMTYLVIYAQRNSTTSSNDAAWIVSTNRNNSHLFALKSSNTTKASIKGLTLTITRGSVYGRITITCLS